MANIPNYPTGYESEYIDNPRDAAIKWFRESNYGLFLHYGLYSLLGRHEWVQLREKIPVAEYAKLSDQFTAEGFDAETIARTAMACEFRYINLTTRHHDSFCLLDTAETAFNSVNAPCGRDLVKELAEACDPRGLELSLYYSHGTDWKHLHAPNNDWGGRARPEYDPPEPTYATRGDHDLQIYLDFCTAQVTKLLENYGPVAAIWLDGLAVPASGDKDRFRCQELYDYIHAKQPQVLVSYKQGLLGTEDFQAPEHKAIEAMGKPMEICAAMCPGPEGKSVSWGYLETGKGYHLDADQVWNVLRTARERNCNLLLNSGPLPDGSQDPEDIPVLEEVGRRIREQGFPE